MFHNSSSSGDVNDHTCTIVNRVFHNYTKLAMLALLPTLYSHMQFSLLFITNDVSKCEIRIQGIHEDYQGYMLYWNSHLSMAELKQSWQCKHSCNAESL